MSFDEEDQRTHRRIRFVVHAVNDTWRHYEWSFLPQAKRTDSRRVKISETVENAGNYERSICMKKRFRGLGCWHT